MPSKAPRGSLTDDGVTSIVSLSFALLDHVDIYDYVASDILGFSVLGTRIVIANSIKVATELLETRSTIYSDRCDTYGLSLIEPHL